MDAERFAEVRVWFDRLHALDAEARERALSNAAVSSEVIARVLALLVHADTQAELSAKAPVSGLLGVLVNDTTGVNSVLGAWTLTRQIGEGGMGKVFEARRSDGHFEQTAAIKLLRGLPSAAALHFLARERQILAGLSHPNIARLLDGGTTPAGQPYLVMALQHGRPIDVYCREQGLSPIAIVRLMQTVCAAIGHAHARLIIHCDLKPSNILVDDEGRPCVLDFGIARLLDGESSRSRPAASSVRARAFTPGFASPELEAGGDITTATDVFSLGRLLEYLLGPAQVAASAEWSALIARACAIDPGARYASVAALSEDLERWLAHRPLQAVPPHWRYLARKGLARHWRVALVVLAFVITGALFTARTIVERNRALAAERLALLERDRAVQAETVARQINGFLQAMLDGANPDAGSGDVPLSKLVTAAMARIDQDLRGQPAAQSELYAVIAGVQRTLGNDELSRQAYQRAIDLERGLARPLILARHLSGLAALQLAAFAASDAATTAAEAHALYQQLSEAPWPERRDAALLAGETRTMVDPVAGARLLEAWLAEQTRRDADGDDMARALETLAGARMRGGMPRDAEPLLRQSLAIRERAPDDAEARLNTMEMLGRVWSDMGRVDDAERILRQALAKRREQHGDDDPHVPWRLVELARVLDNHGRSLEAVPLYTEALDIAERKIGAATPTYAVMLNGLAMSLHRSGDWSFAEQQFKAALAIATRSWGADDSALATLRFNFGRLLIEQGRLPAALELIKQADRARRTQLTAAHPEVSATRLALAEIACRLDRVEEAEAHLAEQRNAVPEPSSTQAGQIARIEACVLAQRGQLDAAIAKLESAESLQAAALAPGHPRRWLNQIERAELLIRRNRGEDRQRAVEIAGVILTNIDDKLSATAPVRGRLQRLLAR